MLDGQYLISLLMLKHSGMANTKIKLYKIPDLVARVKGKFLSAVVCVLNGSKKNGEEVENKPARRRKMETELARRWEE